MKFNIRLMDSDLGCGVLYNGLERVKTENACLDTDHSMMLLKAESLLIVHTGGHVTNWNLDKLTGYSINPVPEEEST